MNSSSLLALSFSVGILVVIQGSVNARLGILLNNPLLATTTTIVISAVFTITAVFTTIKQLPSLNQLQTVPIYMWFTGGALSFLAASMFYYIIPRAGISSTVTFGLFGQIIFAAIAGHYGWFGVPMEPISLKKLIGILVMIAGITIIKY